MARLNVEFFNKPTSRPGAGDLKHVLEQSVSKDRELLGDLFRIRVQCTSSCESTGPND
jgi:hypothetical protein